MADRPRFDPLATRAYELFRTELVEQLRQVEVLIAREGALSPEEVITIGRTFHTIKGGAGFFGLGEISRAAARLEEVFLSQAERDVAEVTDIFESLRRMSVSLPEPTGGVQRCQTS